MNAFTPERLTLARRRRGLKKTELAKAAALTTRSLTDYESGKRPPSEEALARIADALAFPVAFFRGPPLDVPNGDAISFRSMKSMTAPQRDAAIAACALGFMVNDWIEQRFSLPDVDLPDLSGMPNIDPEEAAIIVRNFWGLGLRPIQSMVHLLELHGVRVFSLVERCRDLDAISMWHGRQAFCFLNTMKSAEHARFDAAHELGHLLLHRHGDRQSAEREANAFASAFLMPREVVRSTVPRGAIRADLMKSKRNLRVSLAALTYRAHVVGLLSEWQYRTLCIEMGASGERTREPDPLPNRETSQILQKVFAALRQDGTTKADVARELDIRANDLDALVFGLVVTGVDGGGGGSCSTKGGPPLRLVSG